MSQFRFHEVAMVSATTTRYAIKLCFAHNIRSFSFETWNGVSGYQKLENQWNVHL